MKIETVWEYSVKTEAQRVLHAAHQIGTGFYRINNFYIVPDNYKAKLSTKIVKFPNLNYHSIPRFWEKAKFFAVYSSYPTADFDEPKSIDVLEKLENLIKEANLRKPEFTAIKTKWENASSEITTEITKIMPEKTNMIKKITIHPTVLGTTCSFGWKPNKDGSIFIFLRDDQDIYSITEAILTTLTRQDVYEELSGSWSESELLVDWILTKSSLNKVLTKYAPNSNFTPTLKGTREKQNANLLKVSEDYCKKLGLPINKKVFAIHGTEPTIYKHPTANLTPTEKIILKLLIEKANNVASFDDLGEILFKSEDDFSLYAISKQIERLRNKLEENGVSGSYIQTLRGQGYILKN